MQLRALSSSSVFNLAAEEVVDEATDAAEVVEAAEEGSIATTVRSATGAKVLVTFHINALLNVSRSSRRPHH